MAVTMETAPGRNGHTNGLNTTNAPTPDNYDLRDATEPMAIIDVANRFPGEAMSAGSLWELLVMGRTA